MIHKKKCIILANGEFPKHSIPLKILKQNTFLICLDGAVDKLNSMNLSPNLIIGDLDSISKRSKLKFSKIIIEHHDQSKNDLTKGLEWVIKEKFSEIKILGLTGKREDHTISNIFNILENNYDVKIQIISDYGTMRIIKKTKTIVSFPGQQISFFATNQNLKISTKGLKYELDNSKIDSLYRFSLNESLSNSFKIILDNGPILLFTSHIK